MAIASVVFFVVVSLLSLAGIGVNVARSIVSSKAVPVVNKLVSRLSQDQNLLARLNEAFQRRDVELAESLIGSSPFSSVYHGILAHRNHLQKEFEYSSNKIRERIDDTERRIKAGETAINGDLSVSVPSSRLLQSSLNHDHEANLSDQTVKYNDSSTYITKFQKRGIK